MAENLSRTCQKLRPLLPEHAEGKLSGSPLARVERHLAECSRCSAELADLRTVIAAARAIDADPVPPGLVSRLRGAVADLPETAAGPPRFWPRVAVPVAVATGFVAVAFAFIITGRPQTDLDSMARSASPQAGALVAEAPAPSAAAAEEMTAGIEVAELPDSIPDRADRLAYQAPPSEPSAPDTSEKTTADIIGGYSFTAPSEEEGEDLAHRETSVPQPDRSPRPTLLCLDQLGPRDEAAGDRQYVLFVPTLARLGESAPNAPLGRYAGAPLGRVLADFSALTGLVILAEAPLDMPLSGDLPSGTPAQALQLIATIADMEATQQDDIAHTLTHRR